MNDKVKKNLALRKEILLLENEFREIALRVFNVFHKKDFERNEPLLDHQTNSYWSVENINYEKDYVLITMINNLLLHEDYFNMSYDYLDNPHLIDDAELKFQQEEWAKNQIKQQAKEFKKLKLQTRKETKEREQYEKLKAKYDSLPISLPKPVGNGTQITKGG